MLWEKDERAKIIRRINPERYILVPFIPTAEMMAKAFFFMSQAILSAGPRLSGEGEVRVKKVIVHETATGYGQFGEDDELNDEFPAISFDKWVISAGIKKEWKNKAWFKKALRKLSD